MKETTITEALAELKVVDKRIEKKREFIGANVLRMEQLKDPLEKDGGSVSAIQRELQAVRDLEEQKVAIRRAIQLANVTNTITIGSDSRPIADWLSWRRDVAPGQQAFYVAVRRGIDTARSDMLRKGQTVAQPDAAKTGDVVVNVNETELASSIEELEAQLGTLDGQLSLKNATITISY